VMQRISRDTALCGGALAWRTPHEQVTRQFRTIGGGDQADDQP
jgi:hypothetical protein